MARSAASDAQWFEERLSSHHRKNGGDLGALLCLPCSESPWLRGPELTMTPHSRHQERMGSQDWAGVTARCHGGMHPGRSDARGGRPPTALLCLGERIH